MKDFAYSTKTSAAGGIFSEAEHFHAVVSLAELFNIHSACNAEVLLAGKTKPVSYTHLDVYKRQVFGSFFMALAKKEFSPRGGSAPVTRFVLGMFVMIGSLMFLGCPFRMILRLAGGDLNALLGLAGFACGILVGVFFLNKGYSLKRSYALTKAEGGVFPVLTLAVLALLLAAPAFIHFTAVSYTHLDVYKRQVAGRQLVGKDVDKRRVLEHQISLLARCV